MSTVVTPDQIKGWNPTALTTLGTNALSIESDLTTFADQVRRIIYDLEWSGEASQAATLRADHEYEQIRAVAAAYGRLGDACQNLYNSVHEAISSLKSLSTNLWNENYKITAGWNVSTSDGGRDQRCVDDEVTMMPLASHVAAKLDEFCPQISAAVGEIKTLSPPYAALNMEVTPEELSEISRTKPGEGPLEPDHIDITNPAASEKRFTDAEKYIFSEMKTNINSDTVALIKDLNREREWYERAGDDPLGRQTAAMSAWTAKVAPGMDWDHKPKIEEMMGLSSKEDYFFKDPSQDRAVFYDLYSNIHYGYVGRAAGFDPDTLIAGASLGESVLTGEDDYGDQITMNVGMELYDKYGPDLTQEQLHEGIQEAMRRMEEADAAGKDVPQIRSTS